MCFLPVSAIACLTCSLTVIETGMVSFLRSVRCAGLVTDINQTWVLTPISSGNLKASYQLATMAGNAAAGGVTS